MNTAGGCLPLARQTSATTLSTDGAAHGHATVLASEKPNLPGFLGSRMELNMDRIIAIIFVLLMVGSTIAIGASIL